MEAIVYTNPETNVCATVYGEPGAFKLHLRDMDSGNVIGNITYPDLTPQRALDYALRCTTD